MRAPAKFVRPAAHRRPRRRAAPHAGHAGHHDPPGAAVGPAPAPPPERRRLGVARRAAAARGGRPAWRTRPPPASRAAETRFAPPRRISPSVAPSSRLSDEEGGLDGEGGGLRHCEPCLSAWCSRFLPQHRKRACARVPRHPAPPLDRARAYAPPSRARHHAARTLFLPPLRPPRTLPGTHFEPTAARRRSARSGLGSGSG